MLTSVMCLLDGMALIRRCRSLLQYVPDESNHDNATFSNQYENRNHITRPFFKTNQVFPDFHAIFSRLPSSGQLSGQRSTTPEQ